MGIREVALLECSCYNPEGRCKGHEQDKLCSSEVDTMEVGWMRRDDPQRGYMRVCEECRLFLKLNYREWRWNDPRDWSIF